MSAFAAVVAAVAGVVIAPAGASAAPAPGQFVISGSRSAQGWITLPRKAGLSPSDLDPFEPGAQVHTSGRVGGVLIWSGTELVFAEIKDAALGEPLLIGGFAKPRAGARYKVQLIADGATRVTLSLTGTREHLALHPSTPLTLVRRASTFPLPDSPVTYESVPIDVRPGSLVVVAGGNDATGPPVVAGLSDICIEAKNLPCETTGVAGNSGTGLQSESAAVCIGGVICQIGDMGAMLNTGMAAGHYFAALDSEDTGVQQGAGLTAITLTPVRQRHGG